MKRKSLYQEIASLTKEQLKWFDLTTSKKGRVYIEEFQKIFPRSKAIKLAARFLKLKQ